MTTSDKKRAYNNARAKAMRDLARENPERYEVLLERHLGRSLSTSGRPLSQRVKKGERPWGENR